MTSDVYVLRLEPLSGQLFSFSPGQFAFLHLLDPSGSSSLKRPYSISSDPASKYLEFCIKIVPGGQFTSKLSSMSVGSILGVEGPLGHFGLSDASNCCFLAGGTGVAPMMSMLRFVSRTKSNQNVVFIYSAKNSDSILYSSEMDRISKESPNIKIVVTLTQQLTPWTGELGRISKELMAKNLSDPKIYSYWMCGPLEMIKSFKQYASELGADPKKMKFEGWG